MLWAGTSSKSIRLHVAIENERKGVYDENTIWKSEVFHINFGYTLHKFLVHKAVMDKR